MANFDSNNSSVDHGFAAQNISKHMDMSANLVKSPEWMVMMDDFTASSIEGYEGYAELFSWSASHGRISKGESGNNYFSTSALVHSPVELVLVNNIYAANLDNKLASASNIAEITIIRLVNVGDLKQVAQEVKFFNCKIEIIKHSGDYISVSFRPEKRTNTINQYDQTGAKQGQAVSSIDYTTGAVE